MNKYAWTSQGMQEHWDGRWCSVSDAESIIYDLQDKVERHTKKLKEYEDRDKRAYDRWALDPEV